MFDTVDRSGVPVVVREVSCLSPLAALVFPFVAREVSCLSPSTALVLPFCARGVVLVTVDRSGVPRCHGDARNIVGKHSTSDTAMPQMS